MGKLKAVVVGCGRIAGGAEERGPETHGGAYLARPGVVISACVDFDPAKATAYASAFGCEPFSDVASALAFSQPDIVSVCTPDATHCDIVSRILRDRAAPRVVFLEKPACLNMDELEILRNLTAAKRVDIVVNHTRRFDSHHQALRERIVDGEFGLPCRVHTTYYSGWLHNGVHAVDTLAFLFDDNLEITRITGAQPSPYPEDPTLECTARFANQPGTIRFFGFDENFYQLFELDLLFAGARVRIEDFGNRIIVEQQTVNRIGERVLEATYLGLPERKQTAMQRAVDLICARLEQSAPAMLDGFRLEDCVETMTTIWKGQEMYAQNRLESA